MKKAIISTISTILGVGVVTTSALFLPALATSKEYTMYNFDYTSALNNKFELKTQYQNAVNTSIIDAIHGSKSINNGNYIVYIGSEGEQNNRNFLYNTSSENDFENVFTSRPLNDSQFGDGLKYLGSNEFKTNFQEKNKSTNFPLVFNYIDQLDYNDFVNRDKFYKLVNEFKKLPTSKDSVEGKDLTEEQLKTNKKKKDWAEKNIQFDFAPGKTYEDWEGKTRHFRASYASGEEYIKLTTYIKNKFSGTSDSRGIIFAYKTNSDGKIVGKILGSSSYSLNKNPMLEKYVPTSNFGQELKNFYTLD